MFSNNFIIIKNIKKNYFNILKKNIFKKLPTISRYMSLIQQEKQKQEHVRGNKLRLNTNIRFEPLIKKEGHLGN